MKRFILIVIVLFILGGLAWQGTEKKYTINLTMQEADMFYKVIDNSTASHIEVKRCMDILVQQLKPQIDTIKKD